MLLESPLKFLPCPLREVRARTVYQEIMHFYDDFLDIAHGNKVSSDDKTGLCIREM